MRLITAEDARSFQEKAMKTGKIKRSVFRKIRRAAKREYGAKQFHHDDLNVKTRAKLRHLGFVVESEEGNYYSVTWYKKSSSW